MSELSLVAHIHATSGQSERVKAELERLIAPTRAEAGCLQYELHRDNDDPAHFVFFERWETRERWQAHMASPQIAAYLEATEGVVARFVMHKLTRIN